MLPLTLFTSTLLFHSLSPPSSNSSYPSSLPDPDPDPDPGLVAASLLRQVSAYSRRRAALSSPLSCVTGNPIDDCWRCDPAGWAANRQRLADCSVGFGRGALGGKGGRLYVVTDNSDDDPADPRPGTLRHAVIQEEPLWITFSASTVVRLTEELIVSSFKTIDGRGVEVHITGGGCITLRNVSNVIIHNVHIHHCVPAGNAIVRSSPTHAGFHGRSDGDGISIYSSTKIWIDHCSLSHCTDGLIDVIMGSTGITISNNYFSHHDEVMLMGHKDDYAPDSAMQVTIAFNRFGEALVQRMPRCRRGYFHIVNNDYTGWEMYAIGGSAGPTINSQGNRYRALSNSNAKEVTKRVDTAPKEWARWNWRSEGDVMENGAFFVPSGHVRAAKYGKASSTNPKSVGMIDMLTMNAGVLGGCGRDGNGGTSYSSSSNHGGSGIGGETNNGYLGMIYGSVASGSPPPFVTPSMCMNLVTYVISLLIPTCLASLSSIARDIANN